GCAGGRAARGPPARNWSPSGWRPPSTTARPDCGNVPSCRTGKPKPVKVNRRFSPNEGGFHAMRAHDSHVADDELTEADAGNPGPVPSATGPVPAARAANVRVPPAASHG